MRAHAHPAREGFGTRLARGLRAVRDRIVRAVAAEVVFLNGGTMPTRREVGVVIAQGTIAAFGFIILTRLAIAVLLVVFPILVPEAWQ